MVGGSPRGKDEGDRESWTGLGKEGESLRGKSQGKDRIMIRGRLGVGGGIKKKKELCQGGFTDPIRVERRELRGSPRIGRGGCLWKRWRPHRAVVRGRYW